MSKYTKRVQWLANKITRTNDKWMWKYCISYLEFNKIPYAIIVDQGWGYSCRGIMADGHRLGIFSYIRQ